MSVELTNDELAALNAEISTLIEKTKELLTGLQEATAEIIFLQAENERLRHEVGLRRLAADLRSDVH